MRCATEYNACESQYSTNWRFLQKTVGCAVNLNEGEYDIVQSCTYTEENIAWKIRGFVGSKVIRLN